MDAQSSGGGALESARAGRGRRDGRREEREGRERAARQLELGARLLLDSARLSRLLSRTRQREALSVPRVLSCAFDYVKMDTVRP